MYDQKQTFLTPSFAQLCWFCRHPSSSTNVRIVSRNFMQKTKICNLQILNFALRTCCIFLHDEALLQLVCIRAFYPIKMEVLFIFEPTFPVHGRPHWLTSPPLWLNVIDESGQTKIRPPPKMTNLMLACGSDAYCLLCSILQSFESPDDLQNLEDSFKFCDFTYKKQEFTI